MSRFFLLTLLLSVPSSAQTTGIPFLNDYTLAQQGGGETSCHGVTLPFGAQILDFRISGTPFNDVILAAGQCAPGLASVSGGMSLDIDLSGGFLFDSTGFLAAPLNTPFATGVNGNGDWALSLSTDLSGGMTFTTQAGLFGPSHAAGYVVTQALAATVTSPPTTLFPLTAGGDLSPLGEDSFVNVALAAPFPLYGLPYPSIWINMNGNATFNAGDFTFTPTEWQMLNGPPRIAPAWDDWSPQDPSQGTVRVHDDGTVFQCEWFDVRHYGCGGTGDTNTFGFELDYGTGAVTLRYGTMLLCNALAGSADQVVGLSPGNGFSAPNPVDFWTGAPATVGGVLPFDAVYEDFGMGLFGPFDLGNGQHVGITFMPNLGTYVATSF